LGLERNDSGNDADQTEDDSPGVVFHILSHFPDKRRSGLVHLMVGAAVRQINKCVTTVLLLFLPSSFMSSLRQVDAKGDARAQTMTTLTTETTKRKSRCARQD
jgi:hypothetical protein